MERRSLDISQDTVTSKGMYSTLISVGPDGFGGRGLLGTSAPPIVPVPGSASAKKGVVIGAVGFSNPMHSSQGVLRGIAVGGIASHSSGSNDDDDGALEFVNPMYAGAADAGAARRLSGEGQGSGRRRNGSVSGSVGDGGAHTIEQNSPIYRSKHKPYSVTSSPMTVPVQVPGHNHYALTPSQPQSQSSSVGRSDALRR